LLAIVKNIQRWKESFSITLSSERLRKASIALTLAALNDLEVKASDIMNAYLTSPCERRFGRYLAQSLAAMQAEKRYWSGPSTV
jgi:hypothetical protein